MEVADGKVINSEGHTTLFTANTTVSESDNLFYNEASNESNILGPHVIKLIGLICNNIYIPIVSVFGLVGNMLNIIVLSQHGVKSNSSTVLLFGLSLSDFAFVLTKPLVCLGGIIFYFNEPLGTSVSNLTYCFLHMVTRTFVAISTGLIAVISVERFVAVFFPFKMSQYFTPQNTAVIASLTALSYVFAMSPFYAVFTYKWEYSSIYNTTVATVVPTPFYKQNFDLINLYGGVPLNIYAGPIPLGVVLASGCAISFKLTLNSKQRKSMTHTTQTAVDDSKVMKMLLIVCTVFFVTIFPSTIVHFYLYFSIPDDIFNDPVYITVQYLTEVAYVTNASINFIIYVTVSNKFRARYKKLLCR
ncbi:lysophosphatidic acid receptor 6-like [Aplysia californica]|uniref:Lysophosphatidic acid receptor 6-like n=1 Tax=Aplysia californica TaxID=6500 RepID=A0ABM0JQ76_APLCA|nr:lysophosphatidic acid receptor 6-like [Aplysia californica]